MTTSRRTCGGCTHGVPCTERFKDKKFAPMAGFLVCAIKQATTEERAKFLSPHRNADACEQFNAK